MTGGVALLLMSIAQGQGVPDVTKMTRSTARVVQGSTSCAGVWLDAEQPTVATAYHCVTGAGRVQLIDKDGVAHWGHVTARSARHDLALIRTEHRSQHVATIATDTVEQGERVYAVGHPLASEAPTGYLAGTLLWSVSDGVVSQVGDTAIQHTAPLAGGYSGGPLFNSAGQLIGIHSRRLAAPGLGFSTRVAYLTELLRQEPVRKSKWFGGTVALRPGLGTFGHSSATPYATLELEADLRQRLWARIVGGVAGPDTTTQWPLWEASAGLRQTIGRGPNALHLEAGWSARLLSARFYLTDAATTEEPAATGWSAGLRFRGVGWRANLSPSGRWSGFNLTLHWPGTLTVY